MAETTTATSWPASTSRLTWRATLRMRSVSATEVPPNFITRRAMKLRPFRGWPAANLRVYIPAGFRCRNGGTPIDIGRQGIAMAVDTIRADATVTDATVTDATV